MQFDVIGHCQVLEDGKLIRRRTNFTFINPNWSFDAVLAIIKNEVKQNLISEDEKVVGKIYFKLIF
jgi:hypothetical protein